MKELKLLCICGNEINSSRHGTSKPHWKGVAHYDGLISGESVACKECVHHGVIKYIPDDAKKIKKHFVKYHYDNYKKLIPDQNRDFGIIKSQLAPFLIRNQAEIDNLVCYYNFITADEYARANSPVRDQCSQCRLYYKHGSLNFSVHDGKEYCDLCYYEE